MGNANTIEIVILILVAISLLLQLFGVMRTRGGGL